MSKKTNQFKEIVDKGAEVSVSLGTDSGFARYVVGYAIPVKGDWLMASTLHPVYQQNWHDIVLVTFKQVDDSGATFMDQWGRRSYITVLDIYDRSKRKQWKGWQDTGKKWTQKRFNAMIKDRLETPITFIGDSDVS